MNVNETVKIRSMAFRDPNKIIVSNGVASGGLKWQYIVNCHILPERDYVTFGSLLSQPVCLSVVCRLSVVCDVGAPYSGG